jgi:hypothetical protein
MNFAETVTGAVSGMGGELTTVGTAAITIGVVVFGLRKGWQFLKSMV